MSNPIKTLVNDYGWIHLGLGLLGNTAFLVGSVLFLPAFETYRTLAVWLFIGGALLMWVGAVGHLLVNLSSKN